MTRLHIKNNGVIQLIFVYDLKCILKYTFAAKSIKEILLE